MEKEIKREIEENLEIVWMKMEEGVTSREEILKEISKRGFPQFLKEIEAQGYITVTGESILFTEKGREHTGGIIRRHRLAERFLSELLELGEKEVMESACSLEHTGILSERVVESICTLLGHPPSCPHGKPIPAGPCCLRGEVEVKPLVIPVTHAKIGVRYRVVFISTKQHSRIDRLMNLGLSAGSNIKVHQKRPTIVINLEHTDIAIDDEIAKEIYVKEV